jgi:NitT/TauT family transport system substrate-binding protein
LNATRQLNMSSFYLAQELGFFRDLGLGLEVMHSPNILQALAAMAGGKIEIMFAALTTAFFNATLKGLPMKIVAGREKASPACGKAGVVYGLRRTFPQGLSNLVQLKGRRVTTGLSIGYNQFALDAQLASAGLSMKEITPVTLPDAQAVAALLGGSVDAIMIGSGMDRDLMSLGPDLVQSAGLANVHPDFQYSHILFGNTLLASDPEIGARFLSAYLRGAREFLSGKTPQYMLEFAKTNNLEPQQVMGACRQTFSIDGAVDMESLRLFAAWAARRGHILREIDVSQIVDLRFLRRPPAAG